MSTKCLRLSERCLHRYNHIVIANLLHMNMPHLLVPLYRGVSDVLSHPVILTVNYQHGPLYCIKPYIIPARCLLHRISYNSNRQITR